MAAVVIFEGALAIKETRVSKKTGNPYSVFSVVWMGGSSEDQICNSEDLARMPELGTHGRFIFEGKTTRDGVRPQKFVSYQPFKEDKQRAAA